VSLYSRHSDPQLVEGSKSPHLSQHGDPSLPRRILRLASATLVAAFFLAPFIAARLTPSVHASSKQSRAAGAAIFHDKGCEHCHGVDGIGTDRGPDLSTVGRRWKKERIERQIRNGGGGMPAFGGILQPDDIKALVDYLSAKRRMPRPPVQP